MNNNNLLKVILNAHIRPEGNIAKFDKFIQEC